MFEPACGSMHQAVFAAFHRAAIASVFTTFNEENTMTDSTPQTWPGLGAELFDMLTGRRAEIIYQLDNMEVHIPAGTLAAGSAQTYAVWKFNGAIRIRSRIHSDGA
jgi:hypothetical protein